MKKKNFNEKIVIYNKKYRLYNHDNSYRKKKLV